MGLSVSRIERYVRNLLDGMREITIHVRQVADAAREANARKAVKGLYRTPTGISSEVYRDGTAIRAVCFDDGSVALYSHGGWRELRPPPGTAVAAFRTELKAGDEAGNGEPSADA